MRLEFDRGTVRLTGCSEREGIDLPGVLWDPRVQVYRAPGFRFWTPRYLETKLQRLHAAGAPDLILCVDDSLNCTDDTWAGLPHVIRFERRIDVAAVLAIVEAIADSRGTLGRAT